jgi:hypothetical protein
MDFMTAGNESDKEKSNLWIEQYKLLVKKQDQESNRFWARYSVFLTFNSALLGVYWLITSRMIEVTSIQMQPILPLTLSFCLIGVICSVSCFFQTLAGGAWQNFWISKARSIEVEQRMRYRIYDFDENKDIVGKRRRERFSIIKLASLIPAGFTFLWMFLIFWFGITLTLLN